MKYTLGLDMGVASLGWAVVSEENEFIDSGVRVFPAALDAFNSTKEKHPNQDRRISRGMRRRIRRKAERKKAVSQALTTLGWKPTEVHALEDWLAIDVYELRHRAINEKITLQELGRIIYHLNQRRGFLSLRKTEADTDDKEAQGMLGAISDLEKSIESSGAKTLGNYLHTIYKKQGITERLRNRHFSRKMLHHEFDLIWEAQSAHHSELTALLRHGTEGIPKNGIKVVKPKPNISNKPPLEQFGIEGMTFFQRKVYWKEGSIGKCELEIGEQRAPIADRRFQEFRLLQEVNNLRITDLSEPGSPIERPLHEDERLAAIEYLSGKDKPKLDTLKNTLCKLSKKGKLTTFPTEPALVTFNLENSGRTTIAGTPTDYKLKSAKILGKAYDNFDEDQLNAIIQALTLPAATDEDIREALEHLKFLREPQIDKLLSLSLPTGYGHLSLLALAKLLPPMRKGMLYMHKLPERSAMAAAGYDRRDQTQHETLDLLPRLEEILDSKSDYYDPKQTVINNPVVLRSLTELRKVVNGLIRKHGKPHRIHLEMARALKMGPKQRKEHEKENRTFEKEREKAKIFLESHGIIPTGDALQLVRLWEEQEKQCPYCDHAISQSQLLGGTGEIDIDHIFPFSRSADNSMANKVVCHRGCNADKKNKTPREWLENTHPEAYEAMLQRTRSLRSNKRKRFYAPEIPDGFANRDLNDTAWMAKAARLYLARLMEKPHLIQGTKGTHTALLRDHWQLHSLLRSDGIDLKNRDDHRHHALDAILIALCDHPRIDALLKKHKFTLSYQKAKEEGKHLYRLTNTGDSLSPPWKDFRNTAEKSLNAIWVSHRPRRKLSGALHKETNYGKTADGLLVVRKPVSQLSKKEIEGIRDKGIAQIVREHIRSHGGDPACLKLITHENPLLMPSGTPIHKVRTAIPYSHLTIRKGTDHETHVQSASTHHLAIFSLGEGKFHFEPVTLYEAARRHRTNEPIVQTTYKGMPPEAEFFMHLCSGDSMMATIDGEDTLFIFNTMSSGNLQVKFSYHTDATRNHTNPETGVSLLKSCYPTTFGKNFPRPRKVNILPTGEIRHTS